MSSPSVELSFQPSELAGLKTTGRILGTPAQALTAALEAARTQMMMEMKGRVARAPDMTQGVLVMVADAIWDQVTPSFVRVSAPVLAEAYLKAYRAADAGDVSEEAIHALANKHARQLGTYYHQTSRQAMLEGFNGFVNRRVPAKAAANRVAEAYGLTPRQMRGYLAASIQFERKWSSLTPKGLKREAAKYIVRSLHQRYKTITEQEIHNAEEQGKQLAWMYQMEKGKLNRGAEKMWLTAKDERVCPICGPLHGVKVPINEQFETVEGMIWSPGVHPNCRCQLRLIENKFSLIEGDLEKRFDPHQPRGKDGRWAGGQSASRQLSTKVNQIQGPSAMVLENTVIHRGNQVLGYLKEPRFITTPLKHRDKEMFRLAHGAAAWSRRSVNVVRAREMADADNDYYANKLKLSQTEKSLKSLITAVQSAPSNAPELFRGMTVSPEHLDELVVGSSFTLPMSSFSENQKFSESFARKWGPMISRNRAKREGKEHVEGQPLVFVLEPRAQALNISPLVAERQAEWITQGEFVITQVGEDDGLAVVHLKQARSKVSKDLAGDELAAFNRLHPRAADGRFGVKTRTRDKDLDDAFRLITKPLENEIHDPLLQAQFEDVLSTWSRARTKVPGTLKRKAAPSAKVAPKGGTKAEVAKPKAEVKRATAAVTAPSAKVVTKPKTKPKAKAPVRPDTEVKVIQEATKAPKLQLNKPTYAVMMGNELIPMKKQSEPRRRIALQHAEDFDSNKEQVDLKAAERKQELINDAVESRIKPPTMGGSGGAQLYSVTAEYGLIKRKLTTEELRDIVEWHAGEAVRQALKLNPAIEREGMVAKPDMSPIFTGRYEDDKGKIVGDPIVLSYEEVGRRLGLKASDFDVRVVEIDQGFAGADAKGNPMTDFHPGKSGDIANFTGMFEVVPDSVSITQGETTAVPHMRFVPVEHAELKPKEDPDENETVRRLRRLMGTD